MKITIHSLGITIFSIAFVWTWAKLQKRLLIVLVGTRQLVIHGIWLSSSWPNWKKPGMSKGSQTVMLFNLGHCYPLAYFHCQMLIIRRTQGYHHSSQMSFMNYCKSERVVHWWILQWRLLYRERVAQNFRFRVKPYLMWQHFSDDSIAVYCGLNGIGLNCSTNRI